MPKHNVRLRNYIIVHLRKILNLTFPVYICFSNFQKRAAPHCIWEETRRPADLKDRLDSLLLLELEHYDFVRENIKFLCLWEEWKYLLKPIVIKGVLRSDTLRDNTQNFPDSSKIFVEHLGLYCLPWSPINPPKLLDHHVVKSVSLRGKRLLNHN